MDASTMGQGQVLHLFFVRNHTGTKKEGKDVDRRYGYNWQEST
jgi:hypothetical protein